VGTVTSFVAALLGRYIFGPGAISPCLVASVTLMLGLVGGAEEDEDDGNPGMPLLRMTEFPILHLQYGISPCASNMVWVLCC
jgi:hypothetical protein